MMCRNLIYLLSFILVIGLAADVVSGQEIKINFQPELDDANYPIPVPEGYLPDYGEEFGDRGNGYSYGWDVNLVGNGNTGSTRIRVESDDHRFNTLIEAHTFTWEIELPNGGYNVFLSCGDPRYDDHISTHDVEGVIVYDPDARSYYNEYYVTVRVKDGRLTITQGPGGQKCPIMFLHITRIKIFKAGNPVPENDATHSDTEVDLSWSPGDDTVSHDVYLGDNFDDVNNATTSTPIIYKGRQDPNNYSVIGLIPGTTYYWRIDEVNEPNIWPGDVWSFKIPSLTAYDPDPPDGAIFVDPNVELRWATGLGAELHYVYLGTDEDNVMNANTTSPEYKGSDPNTSFPLGILDKEKTYYWRIDEDDGTNTYTGEVWSFTTIPYVPEEDPNLLCWWKFDVDEDSDTHAIDYSGHDHHGVIYGASLEPEGRVSEALNFDGDGDCVVDEDAEEYLNGLNAITVCMWIKSNKTGTDRGFMNGVDPNGNDSFLSMRYDMIGSFEGGENIIKMGVYATQDPPEPNVYYRNHLESSSYVQTTDWQHVAMTWSSGEVIEFYINGIKNEPTGTSEPNEISIIVAGCTKLIIGKGGKDTGGEANGWNGLIDDVRIYNKVLSEDDIKQVMRGEPNLAWNESPANGSTTDLPRALPLSWSPGDFAAQHDVYFGTDRDVVADADTDTTGIYRGRQADTSYTPPEGVEWGTGPYFWRIDEYNIDGTITEGRIWQFAVADFILVDDMEDYNNYYPDRIFNTWKEGFGYTIFDDDGNPTGTYCGNGTGAQLGHDIWDEESPYYNGYIMETTIVHDGKQSIPYYYNNTATGYNLCNDLINLYYSEARRTLDYPRDWTDYDVKALTLWFRGYAPSFKEGPAGTYTITASGADISGTSDEFRFIYKQLSSKVGSISAKVLSVQNTHEWAKAGVMIRRDLDNVGTQYAAVYITPGQGCAFQARLSINNEHQSDAKAGVVTVEQRAITAPYWVKIERDSSYNFYGYYSSDGVNWQEMAWNPQKIYMPTNVYVGLALTSHNTNAICEAQFSDVKTTGDVTPDQVGGWMNKVIGPTMLSNDDPEPMYVAVANNTGPPAVVYHDDPNAAQINTWTEWNIDLKEFENQGVNLADVNSIAIGLGNKDSTQAGGSGLVYFDDIRLYRTRCAPDKVTLSEADLNSDCVVDFRDLKIVSGEWLDSGPDLSADLDTDSDVDFADYAVLANQWLEEQIWP